jgi:putative Mg2+ transporter-C (MgtC) family protein
MPQLTGGASIALELELLARLLLAVLLGGLLGLERELGRHAAGLRTHILVALGSAAFTIAGTYGGEGLGTNHDNSRVAAQIVTGIGFLGAGTIWRSSQPEGRGVIYGLTTAANIWVAAAVGMLCGYGLYILAAGTAVIGIVVLRVAKRVEDSSWMRGTQRSGRSTGKSVPSPRRRPRGARVPPEDGAKHHRRPQDS